MLILTRKKGEAVDLSVRATGAPICTVEVLGMLADGSVRLGFRAGDDVTILRDNVKRRNDDGEDNRY